MLENILKNRFVQAITLGTFLSSSVPAMAKPTVPPKTNYTLKLDLQEKEYQFPKLELKLADSNCPPYLSPEECNKKSRGSNKRRPEKNKEGPCPQYICPEQYKEDNYPTAPEKPFLPDKSSTPKSSSEEKKPTSDYVWGSIIGVLGIAAIALSAPYLEGTVCAGYPDDMHCEKSADPLSISILIGGIGLAGTGAYFLFR